MTGTIVTKDIAAASAALQSGEVIGMPTETVYGMAAVIDSHEALIRIFDIKKRPRNNPLILHISNVMQLDEVAASIPEAASDLASAFWPGPLTLLLKKHSSVPDIITAGLETVAVRIPNHLVTIELLKAAGKPVAAPSANPFGSISPTEASHVHKYFNGQIPLILDGGSCAVGIESTIVGFENDKAVIHRHGTISETQIAAVCETAKSSGGEKKLVAPGMYPRHYAPKTPLLFSSDVSGLLQKFNDRKVGLLYYGEKPAGIESCTVTCSLSKTSDLNEAAANLYTSLHRLDACWLDLIIVQKFPDHGVGRALNDKLKRANYGTIIT